ncbi:MAG: AsmA family protein [Rhizobiales bacterium]|nr:AsmA family protein [Hyphomicrobiales bacterium]
MAVGALAVLSALMPREAVRDAVTAEIRAVTGLDLALGGQSTVALFPSSDISFYNVRLSDNGADTPALSAGRLTARLRFFPLLLGRVEIADVELVEPTIAITLEPGGRSNWSNLLETLARRLKPDESGASFSEIRIVDGTVTIRDRDVTETLHGVELALAWPSISNSFAATGRFVWRDEPIDASLSLSNFVAALGGNQSGLKIRLSGKPMKVAFDGQMSSAPTLRIDGTLAADSESLRDAIRWTGQRPLPGGGFGRFALKAQTKVAGGTLALTGVNIELDGNAAEGVLTFASGGRRSVQGTLAAEGLDLTPYVSTVRLLTAHHRDWSGLPFSLEGLKGVDLDLRISAAQVVVSGAKFDRTAVAANLRNGNLVVTIGESQAFGGVIKGSLGLGVAEQGADLRAQLQFADVDLEKCLHAIFGLNRLEGKGTLSLAVEGTGASVLALTRSMRGSADLSGKAGALAGLNVEQLLRRLERRPLSGSGDFRTGRTSYDKLAVTLSIHQGTIKVDTMQIEGAAVHVALGGSASIPARELDLKGTATLVARTTADRPAPFELPFVVQGPWDDPIMLPDSEILIRRSGAAAPLLNAVRDQRNREALRSAIDRLTGRPAVSVAPAKAD